MGKKGSKIHSIPRETSWTKPLGKKWDLDILTDKGGGGQVSDKDRSDRRNQLSPGIIMVTFKGQ